METIRRRSWICAALACVAWIVFVPHASAATQTFGFTGGEQTYTVPSGVQTLHVVAVGAKGGRGSDVGPDVGGSAGLGARLDADLAVTPNQILFVEVGGNGVDGDGIPGGQRGFNGGGSSNAGLFNIPGGGGGGATDIRLCSMFATSCVGAPDTLSSRLLVAGGGGGGGSEGQLEGPSGGEGGDAGQNGRTGQAMDCGHIPGGGGGAGTQSSGGAGGSAGSDGASAGNPGTFGFGGDEGDGGTSDAEPGGGGGGGYFGGGAGGSANGCGGGGGGGGSSFAAAAANGVSVATDTTGSPQVVITSTDLTGVERDFSFAQLRRNKRRGTALLTVAVPGPGTLALTGVGLAGQTVSGAGQVNLEVRATGKKRRKLRRTGRVTVNANVTYSPIGADSITKVVGIKLVRRHPAKPPCKRFCARGRRGSGTE